MVEAVESSQTNLPMMLLLGQYIVTLHFYWHLSYCWIFTFMLFMLQVSVLEVTVDAETNIFKKTIQQTLRKCTYKYNSSVIFGCRYSILLLR
jgi:hypothetical protein